MSKEKVELKFEWNWKAQMHSIIKLLEMGDSEDKKYAREELLKLAEKLDNYNSATTHGFLSARKTQKNG